MDLLLVLKYDVEWSNFTDLHFSIPYFHHAQQSDSLGDLGVDSQRWIFKESAGRDWTGLIWHMV